MMKIAIEADDLRFLMRQWHGAKHQGKPGLAAVKQHEPGEADRFKRILRAQLEAALAEQRKGGAVR